MAYSALLFHRLVSITTQPGQFYHLTSPFLDCLFRGVLKPSSEIFIIWKIFQYFNLDDYIDQNHKEGVGEVEKEPDLYRLDVGGAGEAGGDREVDGGEDHHAGDVHSCITFYQICRQKHKNLPMIRSYLVSPSI